jgi:hypothetical protein
MNPLHKAVDDYLELRRGLGFNCVPDLELSDRAGYLGELLPEILLIARENPRLVAAAERQRAVTVKLDFVEPISGSDRVGKLCFHWLHKVRQRGRRRFNREPGNADATPTQFHRPDLPATGFLWRGHLGIRP